jgi:hypothetical protein
MTAESGNGCELAAIQGPLARLIDQHGLSVVLRAVIVVCRQKAETIPVRHRPNEVRRWRANAARLEKAALRISTKQSC